MYNMHVPNMIINYHYLLDCFHYTLIFQFLRKKKHSFKQFFIKNQVFLVKTIFPEILKKNQIFPIFQKKRETLWFLSK